MAIEGTITDHGTAATDAAASHADSGIHIALAAEHVTTFLGLPVTNTLITSILVSLLLFGIAFLVGSRLKLVPGRVQVIFEEMISFVLNYMTDVLGNAKLARRLFPLVITIFLFIFVANTIALVPGIGSVGLVSIGDHGGEFTSLLRSVNTDLNVTLALTIIAFVTIEVLGVVTLGFFKYASKFINFRSFMGFFVGIMELFSEVARLVSFSFRLFGNILAGKILILVIIFFVPYILPVPIMLFELFVGFLQAAIFSLLILFFVKLAITEPH